MATKPALSEHVLALKAKQLSLPIDLRPDASIADFAGPGWVPMIDAVRQLHTRLIQRLYVYGAADSGKSHLLAAICESFQDMNLSAIQVSLLELKDAPIDAISSLEAFDLVALDDLEAIRGVRHWQTALLRLIDLSTVSGQSRLVFASRLAPQDLRLELPDLMSRLQQAPAFALPDGYEMADRQALLTAVMQRRGWQLDPQVVQHLLMHGPKRTGTLLKVFDEVGELFEGQRKKIQMSLIRQAIGFIDNATQQLD